MIEFVDNDTQVTIRKIMDYYYEHAKNNYIPGILNVGNFYEDNADLYIKIIAVKKELPITKTWMKENLTKNGNDNVFNLITRFKYKYNYLYGINPLIWNDEYVTLVEQKDFDVLNMEYIDLDNRIHKNKILYKEKENIMIYFPLIKDYTELAEYSAQYNLYAEIEYRINVNNIIPNTTGSYIDEDGNAINLAYEFDNVFTTNNKILKTYNLMATVKLDCFRFNTSENVDDNFFVFNINDSKFRKLDVSNYDDDMNAGLLVFSAEAVEAIRKYYYIYDLILIPKYKYTKECLVDYLDDVIVFWEGEFNSKLPDELKKELRPFNLKDRNKNIISTAMYNWQLMGLWEVYNDLLPNQQLAYIIRNTKLPLAIDYNLDFYPPRSENEYSSFVNKIINALNLNIEELGLSDEKIELLYSIIDNKFKFDNNEKMIQNYYGLCYLLCKVVGYDQK